MADVVGGMQYLSWAASVPTAFILEVLMHAGRLEFPAQIGNGRDTASFHSGSNLNLQVA